MEWFRTYVKNRRFRVCVNDKLSDDFLMKTGVPQWRILGPILIIIITVELHSVLGSLGVFYHCYADETQIHFTHEGITEAENILGVIFNKIEEWMCSKRLKPKSDKTKIIRVTAIKSMRWNVDVNSVMLGNIPVQPYNSARNFGLLFDNTSQQWSLCFKFEHCFLSEIYTRFLKWHWFCNACGNL